MAKLFIFVGSKKYFTDDKGFSHEAEFDVSDKPVSDKKFDKDGNLVGEGIYKDENLLEKRKEHYPLKFYRHYLGN